MEYKGIEDLDPKANPDGSERIEIEGGLNSTVAKQLGLPALAEGAVLKKQGNKLVAADGDMFSLKNAEDADALALNFVGARINTGTSKFSNLHNVVGVYAIGNTSKKYVQLGVGASSTQTSLWLRFGDQTGGFGDWKKIDKDIRVISQVSDLDILNGAIFIPDSEAVLFNGKTIALVDAIETAISNQQTMYTADGSIYQRTRVSWIGTWSEWAQLATSTDLAAKVDKVAGKQLSTDDYVKPVPFKAYSAGQNEDDADEVISDRMPYYLEVSATAGANNVYLPVYPLRPDIIVHNGSAVTITINSTAQLNIASILSGQSKEFKFSYVNATEGFWSEI